MPVKDTQFTEDERTLLSKVPEDGRAIGNKKLRSILAWEGPKYSEVRKSLFDKGVLQPGRGMGGKHQESCHRSSELAIYRSTSKSRNGSPSAGRTIHGYAKTKSHAIQDSVRRDPKGRQDPLKRHRTTKSPKSRQETSQHGSTKGFIFRD